MEIGHVGHPRSTGVVVNWCLWEETGPNLPGTHRCLGSSPVSGRDSKSRTLISVSGERPSVPSDTKVIYLLLRMDSPCSVECLFTFRLETSHTLGRDRRALRVGVGPKGL